MARDFELDTTDYLENAAAVLVAVPCTFAAWFRAETVDINQTIMSLMDNGVDTHGMYMEATSSNVISAVTADGGFKIAFGSTNFSVDTWHHGCAVYASSTSRSAYLDGGGKVEDTVDATPLNIDTTAIGRLSRLSATNYFDGRIAEVGIWNVALTDNEVISLASGNSPLLVRPLSLQAYWPLYGLNSPEPDLAGSAFNMTVNGPAAANHAPVVPYSARFWGHGPFPIGGFTSRSYPRGASRGVLRGVA